MGYNLLFIYKLTYLMSFLILLTFSNHFRFILNNITIFLDYKSLYIYIYIYIIYIA